MRLKLKPSKAAMSKCMQTVAQGLDSFNIIYKIVKPISVLILERKQSNLQKDFNDVSQWLHSAFDDGTQEQCCGLKDFRDYFNQSQYQKDTSMSSANLTGSSYCKWVPYSCCKSCYNETRDAALAASDGRQIALYGSLRYNYECYTCCETGAETADGRITKVRSCEALSKHNFTCTFRLYIATY